MKNDSLLNYIIPNTKNSLFEVFFDSISDPTLIIDKQGYILYANKSFCDFFKYEFKELRGLCITSIDAYLSHQEALLYKYLTKSLQEGELRLETSFFNQERETVPVEIKITHFIHESIQMFTIAIKPIQSLGNSKSSFAIYSDVLYEQLSCLQSVMDSVPNPIFYKDQDGFYLGCNQAFAHLVKKDRAEIIGSTAFSLFSNDLAEYFHQHDQKAFNNEKIYEYDIELPQKYSDHLCVTNWIVRKSILTCVSNAQLSGVIGIMFDITELKNKEQLLIDSKRDLEEVAQLKQQFLDNVSHEIRSPMNTIMGMGSLLVDDENITQEQKECVDLIHNACKQLNKIIRNISDFSKYDRPSFKLNYSDFSLRSMLEAVEGEHSYKVEKKNLIFKIMVMPDVPDLLVGDSLRLAQILNNLVDNAIKFSAEGEVKISVNVSGVLPEMNAVCLRFNVYDQGIGIPKEKQHDIFKAFHQVDMSRTRKFGGVGLGLSISARLIELMGGVIWLESELSQGTVVRFTVTLNLSEFNK